MSTLQNKVSIQIESQLPEFVQAENPNFIAFMKSYYEFLESAELKLTSLGSIDAIITQAQPVDASSTNYVILEDTNRYHPGEKNKILLEDTTAGAFVNGETITGGTSKATAVIRVEDINDNSRLFISSQNDFLISETVTGGTSNATGVITNYTANPVQNIQQLMQYADIDDTIDQFFDEFKEAFLKTIPKDLTAGVNERTILKNIKDLYRAKGTKKGHQLFFRILLNEEVLLSYPRTEMLRVSAGDWSENNILRVTRGDDTLLMENASATNGDIFLLLEDGGQIKVEDSVQGTSDLLKLVGQEITQAAVIDASILAGGAYYGLGYSIIGAASALIDQVTAYTIGGVLVYELVLSDGSLAGTFATGHQITAAANDDPDVTLSGKLTSIITDYDAALSTSSQYYDIDDPITVTAANGSDGACSIASLTAGEIQSIIVDAGGSGYEIADVVTVTNTNTNGTALSAQIAVVNGGIAPETGDLATEFNITLDSGGGYGAGDILLESSTTSPLVSNYITQEDNYEMIATDHIILENATVYSDGLPGDKIVQESGTGDGDVTDVLVMTEGWGYTKTPTLALPTTGSRTGATIYAKGTNVGSIKDVTIIDAGVHYTAPITLGPFTNFLCTDISGSFTLNETVTGGTSGATGVYKETDATRNIIKLANVVGTFVAGPDKSGETITGELSSVTAIIDSYIAVSLTASQGTLGITSGRYLNEDGFIDEKTKKIQDSYYYQDFSYVVRAASSISTWRDRLIAAMHPAGWQVFGQVDIATAVQSIANITSVFGLGGLFKLIWRSLIGRRLGTSDQGTINPYPDKVIDSTDKANATPALRVYGPTFFTVGQTITGSSSGATGLVSTDRALDDYTENPIQSITVTAGGSSYTTAPTVVISAPSAGGTQAVASATITANAVTAVSITNYGTGYTTVPTISFSGGGGSGATAIANIGRLLYYTSLTGIFTTADTITSGATSATVTEVWGLLGQYDLRARGYIEIKRVPEYMVGAKYGFAPAYRDVDAWKFNPSQVAGATSTRTFNSMNVYPVYLNMVTTITSARNASETTIPVAATDNLPIQGTIKLENEEITYTGRSTASGTGNLTGATRGANSTTAASHVINTNLTQVKNATKTPWRIEDFALFDDQLTPITFARVMLGFDNDITSWVGSPKNGLCMDAEITVGKT